MPLKIPVLVGITARTRIQAARMSGEAQADLKMRMMLRILMRLGLMVREDRSDKLQEPLPTGGGFYYFCSCGLVQKQNYIKEKNQLQWLEAAYQKLVKR